MLKLSNFTEKIGKTKCHDEGCCNSSALPRHDPTKEKRNDFGNVISKTRGACVITRI